MSDPVLLLHGWGGTAASTWHQHGWLDELHAAARPVLAPDLPGHGPGSGSASPADYADLATTVAAELPAEGVRVDAVGFSLGAKILLEIACRAPHRFHRLVLGGLGANAFAPERLGEAVARALLGEPDPQRSPGVDALVGYATATGNDPAALAACLRRPPNPVLTPQRLARLQLPVLLIAGDEDAQATPIDPLAAALPDARTEILGGVTHLGLPADPRFRAAALSFVAAAHQPT